MVNIKVVGSGCPNCQKLASLCHEVISENNIDAQIEKVTEFQKFAELGILMTPGLLINGVVMSSGKIPSKSTLENWIKNAEVK
jgi:small redox-active disulfide protein 2